ncbi:MAG: signal peptide peptidase SppA [Bacteroidetes bacterium]|nr:signal peptide peptidase SppA [Bacteroidota bacterium]
MKTFFSTFFGAIVGVVVAGIVCTLIFTSIIVSSFKKHWHFGGEKKVHVEANSVLTLKFKQPIKERGSENPLSDIGLGFLGNKSGLGLDDLLISIKKAETDTAIKGIYMDLTTDVEASSATLQEIRNALLHFKSSKKFIYSYSENYSQKGYYLASVADKIYMHPEGEFVFKGLSAQIMYYKTALQKASIDVQVFRHGKFKSAVEPYLLDKMSEPNRMQLETLLNSIWGTMLQDISASRGISTQELQQLADELKINFPADAQQYKLVDELKYKDEVVDALKQKLNVKEKEKINFVSIGNYTKHLRKKHRKEKHEAEEDEDDDIKAGKNKIAVVYAVGEIASGEGNDEAIGSETTAKAIRDARNDSTIKAVVLRVNSPGGSALASDVIWREVVLTKKVKPVVVSMGDVAASGGYYISCAANRIFAQPNTITGSIGVFGLIPSVQRLLSEKIGINVDTVNTNKHSDIGTMYRTMNAVEGDYIQKSVEQVYGTFTKRVAEGRGIPQAQVDSIGQGRVWSGSDALKIKLVDELGGIEDAINYTAKTVNLKEGDYDLVSFPKKKDPLKELFNNKKEEEEIKALQQNLGVFYNYIKSAQTIIRAKGVQARMPYEMTIQ